MTSSFASEAFQDNIKRIFFLSNYTQKWKWKQNLCIPIFTHRKKIQYLYTQSFVESPLNSKNFLWMKIFPPFSPLSCHTIFLSRYKIYVSFGGKKRILCFIVHSPPMYSHNFHIFFLFWLYHRKQEKFISIHGYIKVMYYV